MKIHEYQAKELLGRYGVAVQKGYVAQTPEAAADGARLLGGDLFVVKAQVHSGGRGKAGGVKLARTPEEAAEVTKKMLGMKLVTNQTGPDGKIVRKVLITEGADIEKEYYLSVTVDNEHEGFMIIASGEGGTEIEVTAVEHPEKIVKEFIPFATGLKDYHARYVGAKMGILPEHIKQFVAMLKGMYALLIEKDCSLVEINPLVLTKQGALVALDAKVNFDDNALYRHPDIVELRDFNEEDPKEIEAGKYDLNYVSLDGNIGCMVNGAGLAMATMDIIKAFGGLPANFLDVGGSATTERVTAAFKILLSDPNVKAIMVNIFGGIMKCDVIAEGIVAAANETKMTIPLIVRLDGTNVERGKEILSSSGLKITPASSMAEAAHLAVKAAKEGK